MNLREKLPQYVIPVAEPAYDYMHMPLGGIPGFVPPFTPGYVSPIKYVLNIPGVPRLISRGKDNFVTNWMIDHFGLVFATGPNDMPLPNDVTFELRADSNHEHTPMPYWKFPKKWGPVTIYKIKIDSKAKVIERLEEFFKDPKSYGFWMYNCEDFAREILTGIPECQQREKVVETSKMVIDVAGQVLVKWAEMEKQRMAAEEEAGRRQTAAAAQAPAPVSPPAQVAQPSAQVAHPAPVAPPPPKRARKPATKKPRKKGS